MPPGMGLAKLFRRRQRLLLVAGVISVIIYAFLSIPFVKPQPVLDVNYYRSTYPKAWKHIFRNDYGAKAGGVWYIPPAWLNSTDETPGTILEAARLAERKAQENNHTMPFSKIPLIIHQTWKDTRLDTWAPDIAGGVEQWLTYAMADGGSMAYFLWLDNGCAELIHDSTPDLEVGLKALPLPVMRSDVFRVVVVNSVGGIYGDIDTHPLKDPRKWLNNSSVKPWMDPMTHQSYDIFSERKEENASRPVRLLLGIEADTIPGTDTHWRMGYTYPVQLTQWALAGAPNHPVLNTFVENFASRLSAIARPFKGDLESEGAQKALRKEDPLALTGPEAITVAAREELGRSCGLRWDAVSGLKEANEDGKEGRAKVVGSTVILPITAFSPGRGKYGNMGSKPLDHPDALLQHKAQGSWRKVDISVELGKACRTLFGMCKDWSKVPG